MLNAKNAELEAGSNFTERKIGPADRIRKGRRDSLGARHPTRRAAVRAALRNVLLDQPVSDRHPARREGDRRRDDRCDGSQRHLPGGLGSGSPGDAALVAALPRVVDRQPTIRTEREGHGASCGGEGGDDRRHLLLPGPSTIRSSPPAAVTRSVHRHRPSSCAIRSSGVSRRRINRASSPSTITSAGRGR